MSYLKRPVQSPWPRLDYFGDETTQALVQEKLPIVSRKFLISVI
jgi:hypothetical protein